MVYLRCDYKSASYSDKLGFEKKNLTQPKWLNSYITQKKETTKMFLLRICKYNRIQPYEWSFTVPYRLRFYVDRKYEMKTIPA